MDTKMQQVISSCLHIRSRERSSVSFRTKPLLLLALLFAAVCASSGQTMSTFAGLNTTQSKLNATAAPDVTIAVGLTEYCEHVNSAYQCWYKSGPNANQPVKFL